MSAEGRENGCDESSKWQKSALLVIDMQNDFIVPGGPMWVKGGAAIVPAVQRAITFAREKGTLIIWVKREHHASGRDVERFRRHHYAVGETGPTVKGTVGAELVDGLEFQPEDQVIVKYRFSAFFGTNMHLVLHSAGIETVIVVGVQTPNCIRQTVFDAVAHDYPNVIVLSDATGAASPEVHEANLIDMRNVGVSTPTLAEWMGAT
ncbi:hypothetical protein GOP47_0004762 [Adiantum capillus-veneris]|uniref:Isochorismatase-like domain-containing protein n=1 Tax=Adiantum capillus-veneris TaxID=13818 RepID=A0A9D4ZKR6_ADICA|nr:hypothetical protein GOP47_0004762 [Adiantum capillus-veneris]